jgi:spermidine/putrescine transport system permease protein
VASTFGRRRDYGLPIALPSIALYAVFFVAPLLLILAFSFGEPAPLSAMGSPVDLEHPSFDRYAEVFSPLFIGTLGYTFTTAVAGTLVCLLTAMPVAYFLSTRVPARWRTHVIVALMIPYWTNYLLRTFSWRIILAPSGLLPSVLPLDILDTRAAVQLGLVYNYLPLAVLPMYVALDRIAPSMRSASKDLGAGPLATFWHVTLPMALPGFALATALLFIPMSGDFVTAQILGGSKGGMAGNLVTLQFGAAQNWALGSAMAFTLVLLISACLLGGALVYFLARSLTRRIRRIDAMVVTT